MKPERHIIISDTPLSQETIQQHTEEGLVFMSVVKTDKYYYYFKKK